MDNKTNMPKEKVPFSQWLKVQLPFAIDAVKLYPTRDAKGNVLLVNGKEQYINPLFLFAQHWAETGGNSALVRRSYNVGSITAMGGKSAWWDGTSKTQSKSSGLWFRVYPNFPNAWNDMARLLSTKYKMNDARTIESYAKKISGSKYISESVGDDRALYEKNIISSYNMVLRELQKLGQENIFQDFEKK